MKKTTVILLVILGLAIGFISGYLLFGEKKILSSVVQGNDYYATSTPWDIAQADGVIKKGAGSLGQVVITSSGNLNFRLLDATSTEVAHLAEVGKSTSTAEIAVINTATVGTYIFDINFTSGLYLDVLSGTNGTTTITYR